MNRYSYYCSCVDWPKSKVDDLSEMVDRSIEISRKTFLGYVNRQDLKIIESSLGYSHHRTKGLVMSSDWGVSYHRSRLYGKRVYFFCHSSIEYVFVKGGETE